MLQPPALGPKSFGSLQVISHKLQWPHWRECVFNCTGAPPLLGPFSYGPVVPTPRPAPAGGHMQSFAGRRSSEGAPTTNDAGCAPQGQRAPDHQVLPIIAAFPDAVPLVLPMTFAHCASVVDQEVLRTPAGGMHHNGPTINARVCTHVRTAATHTVSADGAPGL